MTERELITLLREQPERALPLLIERYSGLVFSVLRAKAGSLARQEDLEELASDCFLAVYAQRETIDCSKGSPASLLAVIAQRKAIDFIRRQKRFLPTEALGDENIFTEAVQNDPTETLTDRAALLGAVHKLGRPDADIVFRKYYLGQSHREIGAALGLSENAVTKRLRRCIEKLRDAMKGETFDG